MTFHSRLAVLASSFLAAAATACGSTAGSHATPDAGGHPADSGGRSPDASSHPKEAGTPDSTPPPPPLSCNQADSGGPSSAEITGPGLSASTCLSAGIEGLATSGYAFKFYAPQVPLTAPTDGSDASLIAFLELPSQAPGTYSSSDSSASGYITFMFNLPVPSWVHCGGTTPPDCPAGCTTACAGGGGSNGDAGGGGSSGEAGASDGGDDAQLPMGMPVGGCLPCEPNPPVDTFTAGRGSFGSGGSWTLDLTEASPVAHGTLTATLPGSATTSTNDAGPSPGNATLKVMF
jgi:hypothetical protein